MRPLLSLGLTDRLKERVDVTRRHVDSSDSPALFSPHQSSERCSLQNLGMCVASDVE